MNLSTFIKNNIN
ncbi:hypothetical protein [Plasmodium yoelii yoelii]|uniref:Uncharacterized protein n=2 Tax=Plasmodium yoelii TaxID=5861 RepID=Q7RQJ4_PLAYO|nr:hypothetical protein [Plasmodium yoelii yoelii]